MKRFVVVAFFLFSFLTISFGLDDPHCVRDTPDDLYEYKEAYVPVEFDFKPFSMELADLVVLVGMLAVGTWISLKKKPSKWISGLMLAGLLYFGFFRGGCICPVGATTNFCMGLAAPELIGKVVAALFLLPLVFAFFVGRVFCGSACPLGAVQHLLASKKGYMLPQRLNAILRLFPIAVLGATVWGALRGGFFLACKLDVYKLLFFTGYAWIDQLVLWTQRALTEPRIVLVGDALAWATLFFVLLLGVVVPRPFCRFACPYGVLLGVVSKLGLRHRTIDTVSCVSCVQCEKSCPVQAIASDPVTKEVVVSDFHCIQCGRCDESCKLDSIFSGLLGKK